jgi:hypothetical protein
MSKTLIAAVLVASALMATPPKAYADTVDTEVCRAVMAMGVNPFNPNDNYAVGMVERYPDMTYNQAKALVERAYRSVQYHENPMCDGIKIPENY